MAHRLEMLALLVVVVASGGAALPEPTIRFAAVIYRHGARTPVDPYPNDPWRNESLWPERFGELTNQGKAQHYLLGQWFRKRYAHLLSTKFDPTEIYMQSTSRDRTIMSALANAAGMFPPSGQDVWRQDLGWQPVPLRTMPASDEVLTMNKPCPRYKLLLHQYKQSQPYRDQLAKYGELMAMLSEWTGSKVTNFDDIIYIYSTLSIEKENNFTLPSWTNKVFPDKMREPAGYSFGIESATAELARLKTGPLLREIGLHMSNFSAAPAQARRVLVYSAHDTTVGNVLTSLGLFRPHCPPFTATVLLELLTETPNGTEFLVRVSYRNSSAIVEPEVLEVPGCGRLCPLPRFLALYHHLVSVDWQRECTQQFILLPWLWLVCAAGAIILTYVYASKLFASYMVRVAYLRADKY